MTASLPTPVSGPLRKPANGTTDCLGRREIAAGCVEGLTREDAWAAGALDA